MKLQSTNMNQNTVSELNHKFSEMLTIPSGRFRMGSTDGAESEKPVHVAEIDSFLMDSTLVTNRHFQQFVLATGYLTEAERNGCGWGYDGTEYRDIERLDWRTYSSDDRLDHPVVMVSWNDADEFAKWVGKRLPTEAEWEYVARGGIDDTLYPWGNDLPDGTQCNFARNPDSIPPTTGVRAFGPNRFGIYDLVGNVWQYCSDWFDENSYSLDLISNPTGPAIGQYKVRRGGSWNVIQAFRLRCSNRGACAPSMSAPNMGFRCAADISYLKASEGMVANQNS